MVDLQHNPQGGRLFLVVGPSGVGKDSVIDGLRAGLAEDASVSFPRRYITRPQSEGGEDHIGLTQEQFLQRKARDGFLFDWRAHGLRYGIGREVGEDLARGVDVVVNVSRTIVPLACERHGATVVLAISARPETLRRRLIERARASDGDLDARLARAAAPPIVAPEVHHLSNDGDLEETIARALTILGREVGHGGG